MSSRFGWLDSADVVWQLQYFFGVRKLSSKNGHASIKFASPPDERTAPDHKITWHLPYYACLFASLAGSEDFYGAFFPFWFWNVDETVGRRSIIVVGFAMYVGQAMKDILQIPRPKSPPVVRLETFYLLEYGMPSTHSLVSVATPLCVYLFHSSTCDIQNQAVYSFMVFWPCFMAFSRLYLGVHTILQVLAGVAVALVQTALMVPVIRLSDQWFMSSWNGLLIFTIVLLLLCFFYPSRDGVWTHNWADSVALNSSMAACVFASKLALHLGLSQLPTGGCSVDNWLEDADWSRIIFRTLIGYCIVFVGRALLKLVIYHSFEYIYGIPKSQWSIKTSNILHIIPKFVTYWLTSFCTFFVAPLCFYYFSL